MDKQEVFDKVATHLLTQMVRSADEDGCLYRGPNGLKCAIGCLIPDDKYDSGMEGLAAVSILVDKALPISIPDEEAFNSWSEYLRVFQQIHDHFHPAYWFSDLEELALIYQLSTDCLDSFRKNI